MTRSQRGRLPAGTADAPTAGLVSCVVAGLLLPVAGGRWGSYLQIPGVPVYLADILVAVGVLALLRSRSARLSTPERTVVTPRALVTGSVAFTSIIIIALMSTSWANPALVVRDLVPLAYLAAVPLFFQAIAIVGHRRVLVMLRWACVIHTAWFLPAVFLVLPPIPVAPFSELPVFTTRGDFDLLIAALSIVVFVVDDSLPPGVRTLLTGVSAVSLLAGGSRAGLISGLLLLVTAYLFTRRRGRRLPPTIVAAGAFASAILAPFIIVAATDPPTWMRAIIRLFDVGSQQQLSATNTWGARNSAWQLLIQYTVGDPLRMWWGSGPGSQPVRDSGAVTYLSGETTVRAAHNFLVTWFAFFGLVGIVAVGFVIVVWLLGAAANAALTRGVQGVGFALALAVIAASLGGVILESPFGYMTFIFGICLAYQRATSDAEPDSPSPADLMVARHGESGGPPLLPARAVERRGMSGDGL